MKIESIDISRTALIVVDLQQNLLQRGAFQPHTKEVLLANNNRLADAFKNKAGLIALIGVKGATLQGLHPYYNQNIENLEENPQTVLSIFQDTTATNLIKITKHNPGAFFGTDLDLQLRRRGIQHLILTGISTSNGVYATALDAFQYAYHVTVVEDACSDRDDEKHRFFFDKMFGRISQTVTTDEVLNQINK